MVERICSFPDCGRRARSRGLCPSHRDQRNRGEELRPIRPYAPRGQASLQADCLIGFCHRKASKRGMCESHYAATKRGGRINDLDSGHERRFFAQVQQVGDCWEWVGVRTDEGYGRFLRSTSAHRWSYEFFRGDIPTGLTIDHLCRNRACVNPEHLEPVPSGVNTLRGEAPSAQNKRKTECCHGHPFSPDNTIVRVDGGRRCRACMNAYNAKVAERRRPSK